jgi:hypothetical protein
MAANPIRTIVGDEDAQLVLHPQEEEERVSEEDLERLRALGYVD